MIKKPDRVKFLETLENAANLFSDNSKSLYNNIIAISHNDADGISSLQIIQNLLYRLNLNYDYFIYNRSSSWATYLNGILPKRQNEKTALILTDIGSTLTELIPIIIDRKEQFFILDHHEVENDFQFNDFPENLIFVNPTIYGYDGLDHIAGATLTYMFAKLITPNIIKHAWLTAIGIAGDSLRPMDRLESFNKEIYEELVHEELIEDKQGLILFGGMHNSIKNGLKYSILPFVKNFGGESDLTITSFLNKLQITPNKGVSELTSTEIKAIKGATNLSEGHYAILPQKEGLLQFVFEHALLLNILSFKNISAALSMIQQKGITRYAKTLYYDYISNLTMNLKTVSNELNRFETERAVFIDAGNGKIPPSNWSDTASFSMVNELINPEKMLFLGGLEKKTQMIKLSIRCSRRFLEINKQLGVNKVITKIKEELGGNGGGHKLAGGIRLSIPSFNRLKSNIDHYIE
ncbi:MAG: DHHA1 domain-containing protein [Candidatus Hodarchaeota archaeon]